MKTNAKTLYVTLRATYLTSCCTRHRPVHDCHTFALEHADPRNNFIYCSAKNIISYNSDNVSFS